VPAALKSCIPLAFAALLPLLMTAPAVAVAQDEKDRQIEQLQEQVRKLEARLADLEKRVGPLLARGNATGGAAAAAGTATQAAARDEARSQGMQAKARERMRQDLQKHNRAQLGEAEQLYQVANKNWRSDEAKQSLQQMVEKFPDVNRTGCAVLYLGQMSEGEERERLLKDAAEKYGDCYYGNGVQVGAYARFLLAHYYRETGKADEAKQLFDEIRTKYPDAIDHRGRSLVAQIPAAGNAE
jgi:TolA-binding protein